MQGQSEIKLTKSHTLPNKIIITSQGSSQEFVKEYRERNCGGGGGLCPRENFWYFRWLTPIFCIFFMPKKVLEVHEMMNNTH